MKCNATIQREEMTYYEVFIDWHELIFFPPILLGGVLSVDVCRKEGKTTLCKIIH